MQLENGIVATDTNAVLNHFILSYTTVSLLTTTLQTVFQNVSSHPDLFHVPSSTPPAGICNRNK